jgi:hypothetical protein
MVGDRLLSRSPARQECLAHGTNEMVGGTLLSRSPARQECLAHALKFERTGPFGRGLWAFQPVAIFLHRFHLFSYRRPRSSRRHYPRTTVASPWVDRAFRPRGLVVQCVLCFRGVGFVKTIRLYVGRSSQTNGRHPVVCLLEGCSSARDGRPSTFSRPCRPQNLFCCRLRAAAIPSIRHPCFQRSLAVECSVGETLLSRRARQECLAYLPTEVQWTVKTAAG